VTADGEALAIPFSGSVRHGDGAICRDAVGREGRPGLDLMHVDIDANGTRADWTKDVYGWFGKSLRRVGHDEGSIAIRNPSDRRLSLFYRLRCGPISWGGPGEGDRYGANGPGTDASRR
jgi:hypothetical protein